MENFLKSFTDIKNEIINVKAVIIKNPQNENKRLNDAVNQFISLESKSNSDEQYDRRNNTEINGIPNSIFSVDNLKSIVINVLSKVTNVHVTADNIEACHGIEKSKGNSKKTIARFINRKHCICAFVNRKKLKAFNGESIGLPSVKLYFNENSTVYNNTLIFYGCKLRHAGVINRAYTLNRNLHILRTVGERSVKIFHISKLLELYPNFEFSNNGDEI